jgi:hypothetical protein
MSAVWEAGGLGQFERPFGLDLNRSRKDSAALSRPFGPLSRHLKCQILVAQNRIVNL